MRQSRGQAEFDFSPVSLHLSASPAAEWEHVVLPWFKSAARLATTHASPACVVVPHRAVAQQLRARLVTAGVSLLGVRFFVPAQLREVLRQTEQPHVPLREHLRLLLSVAADQSAAVFEHAGKISDAQIASAVAREPDQLLRAIDTIAAAGEPSRIFASATVAEIAARFAQLLTACDCALVSEADRLLLQQAAGAKSGISHLLVVGFDAVHWLLWPLLHAAARSAQSATIALRDARHEAAELDRVWISTWEENFGPTQVVPVADEGVDAQFERLLALPRTATDVAQRKQEPLANVDFVIGRDSNEQARAIAALAIGFLQEKSCDRVAILLPGAGALARLVASCLERLRIPHNDVIAHPLRGAFDTEEWRAWLELQQQPRLGPLLRFVEHSPAAAAFFAPLSGRTLRDLLQRACGDILINAVDVLQEYCRRRDGEANSAAAAKGLAEIEFLPEQATFTGFVTQAHSIFRSLNWSERSAELDRLSRGWSEGFEVSFSRERFLRWITDIFAESSLARDTHGHHPYARVQLLRYDQAHNQTWSHVVFGGLNEGVWPPTENESPFISDDELAALNRQNTQPSRFGAGQSTVRDGAALCLGSRERRAIALRQLLDVIDSTTGRIAVAAQLYTQSPREQSINPSEFYARLFFSARGEALSQRNIARTHEQTRAWLAQTPLSDVASVQDVDLAQTAYAYRERRRADTAFGEFEFAIRQDAPPKEQVALSATDVANLLKWPALVWIKTFLHVQNDELETGSWNLATGQWVHRWLALMGAPRENRFVARPSGDEALERVTAAADTFRTDLLSILQACRRTREPDWWRSGWRNARHLAENFATQIAQLDGWPQIATEWTLDRPHLIALANGDQLRVTGRIDVILADADSAERLWIVDYKTGVAKPLKSHARDLRKQLIGGDGVQICVYALALQSRAKEIDVSLLTREAPLDAQIGVDQVVAHADIWAEIARMQRTGVFGMKGELRSEFAFVPAYPLAMLGIDKELLREKWERTHPAFARRTSE